MIERYWSTLHPPRSILVLGLLSPASFRQIISLGAEDVVVIHPDADAVSALAEPGTPSKSRLEIDATAISSSPEASKFYRTSLPRESGFIAPSRLKFLWKNICSEDAHECATVTLGEYLSKSAQEFNWIVSERLDIGRLLEEAKDHIRIVDLIFCRHLVEERGSELGDYLSVHDVMNANGFVPTSTYDARHPALISTLFVNDWKRRLQMYIESLESSLRATEDTSRARADEFDALKKQFAEKQEALKEMSVLKEQLAEKQEALKEMSGLKDQLAEKQEALKELQDAKRKGALAQNNLSDLRKKYGALIERNKKLEDFAGSVLEEANAAKALLRNPTGASKSKDRS